MARQHCQWTWRREEYWLGVRWFQLVEYVAWEQLPLRWAMGRVKACRRRTVARLGHGPLEGLWGCGPWKDPHCSWDHAGSSVTRRQASHTVPWQVWRDLKEEERRFVVKEGNRRRQREDRARRAMNKTRVPRGDPVGPRGAVVATRVVHQDNRAVSPRARSYAASHVSTCSSSPSRSRSPA